LAGGKGLEIINISNPSNPGKIGELEFDNNEGAIHVKGNYAYAVTVKEGLKVIDVTIPSSPKLVKDLDIGASNICVSGNYAYVLNYRQLVIVDISIPSQPTPVGIYCTEADTGLCVIDNYVYLISSYFYYGVKIIDVSTPSSPVMVNYFKPPELALVRINRIFFKNNYAYLSHRNGVSILDVSNPLVPILVGNLETGAAVGALDVKGNYAYAAGYYDGPYGDKVFRIIDVSNPSAPVLLGKGKPSEKVFNLQVKGNYLYAAVGQGGLEIFNVSNPKKPEEVGNYDKSGQVLDIEVRGNYAYLAGESAMLKVLNISNPSAPTLIGTYGDREGFAQKVQLIDHYAYLFSPYGFLILDISSPARPKEVGRYPLSSDSGISFHVGNNHAYMLIKVSGGAELQVIDLTDPTNPKKVGTYLYSQQWHVHEVYVIGNYLYWYFDNYLNKTGGLLVDVSDPTAPTLVKNIDIGCIRDLDQTGKYAYTSSIHMMKVVDVSDPSSPAVVGEYHHSPGILYLQVNGNYVYLFDSFYSTMTVVDVSNPNTPTLAGANYRFPIGVLYAGDNYLYVGRVGRFLIFSINDPHPFTSMLTVKSLPSYEVGISVTPADREGKADGKTIFNRVYDKGTIVTLTAPDIHIWRPFSKWTLGGVDMTTDPTLQITMDQSYTATAHYGPNLTVHKLTVSSSPVTLGVNIEVSPGDIAGNSNGATYFNRYYQQGTTVTLTAPPVVNGGGFLKWVVDSLEYESLSVQITMASPHLARAYYEEVPLVYALAVQSSPVIGVNIAAAPKDIYGNNNGTTNFNRIYQEGTTVTLTAPGTSKGKTFSKWTVDGKDSTGSQVLQITMDSTHTAIAHYEAVLSAYTLTIQSSPGPGVVITVEPDDINGKADGTTVFTRTYNQETMVTLTAPETYDGKPFSKWTLDGVDATANQSLQITMGTNHTVTAHYAAVVPPFIALNRSGFNFGAAISGSQTGEQTLLIENIGGGLLNWSAAASAGWLLVVPSSGTGDSEVFVSVNAAGLSPGTYQGTITVSAPDAANSPLTVPVTFNVYHASASPFGVFSTPVQGAVVQSSIPVTGWALDDIGVKGVKIYRDRLKSEGGGMEKIYIGDAVLVEGARPDVEAAYPDYPMNYKAGWGYMMLTNFLPNGGNGTFNIHAIVTDEEGNQVNLGAKTITCDNANAVKPFGALDTPAQGGTASGSDFVNFGWALTPLPNTIPVDGSTITVWVDGVAVGTPVYNEYRNDIAALFPGYHNSDGAGGHYYLDTTQYENGVHTIQWTVTDDAGNTDGIGSRYFNVRNQGTAASQKNSAASNLQWPTFNVDIEGIPVDDACPILVRRWYNRDIEPQMLYPEDNGNISIEIKELERLEVRFTEGAGGLAPLCNAPLSKGTSTSTRVLHGFQVIEKRFTTLPIGSTLDVETGVFTWEPGVGFLGEHRLVFLVKDAFGHLYWKVLDVKIVPASEEKIEKSQ
ncbi:hypothetical protein ACFLQP_02730, partial [Acidobacteriota bacterium]